MLNIGVVGCGNVGKGVAVALKNSSDCVCTGVFTRRDPKSVVVPGVKTYGISELEKFKNKIDVLILCYGSASDLPDAAFRYLKDFCTVDSFDTHSRIAEYRSRADKIAKESDKLCVIGAGWDPGMFSLTRAMLTSVLPTANVSTFWGKGVSRGHSEAATGVAGVKDAVSFTVPIRKRANGGKKSHKRICYVTMTKGADVKKTVAAIKSVNNYFSAEDTCVRVVGVAKMNRLKRHTEHRGRVVCSGRTSKDKAFSAEFSLNIGSNAEYTGCILVAYARAAAALYKEGKRGAATVLDIPIKYLSPLLAEQLMKHTL